ncbi:EamA family transporter [Pedobacter cryophilus]|uniref:Permease n=1 Tax=Pedobacter cryophilus TaxID=2571271 RepID=A0A4U1C588_9SPHI|nr:EamA family transporter [Pedobacter cryophilus]TKC00583.1 permease [Pedobacter cryophilus]
MSKRVGGLLAALSANIIWGFFSIALRFLKDYSVDQILYYRIFVSFIICWIVIFLFNRKQLKSDILQLKGDNEIPKLKLWFLIVLSGVLITLNWFTFIYVVNNVNLKSGAFAYMVCPLITALGGFLILKEELSRLKLIAIAIAIISIITLATGSFTDVMWSVITAAFYAFFLVIQRIIKNISKLNMLGFQLLIALFLILPLFFINLQPIPLNLSFWVDIVIIAVLFTLVPLLLSLFALNSLPSSTVGIIIYVNPIVAFGVAFFYFHETIKMNQLFAYSLLAIAVVIFNWKILKENIFKIIKSKPEVDVIS